MFSFEVDGALVWSLPLEPLVNGLTLLESLLNDLTPASVQETITVTSFYDAGCISSCKRSLAQRFDLFFGECATLYKLCEEFKNRNITWNFT